jgi:uncharacterized protein
LTDPEPNSSAPDAASSALSAPAYRKLIAPAWHFALFFVIVGWTLYAGWAAQHHALQNPQPPSAIHEHAAVIRSWLIAAGADLLFLFYCWAGVRGYGGSLFAYIGGRWKTGREFLTDIVIAIPFWIVWELVAYGVYWIIGSGNNAQVFPIFPNSFSEALAWTFLSITAGVCEELIFRGYLQTQFLAISGSRVFAVIAQGFVFGAMHSYQGWRPVLVISILGMLYGALAAWRRNLRVNIITHAWTDLFEGWLKFLMFPLWFPH